MDDLQFTREPKFSIVKKVTGLLDDLKEEAENRTRGKRLSFGPGLVFAPT
jgi:hypothetical protein